MQIAVRAQMHRIIEAGRSVKRRRASDDGSLGEAHLAIAFKQQVPAVWMRPMCQRVSRHWLKMVP